MLRLSLSLILCLLLTGPFAFAGKVRSTQPPKPCAERFAGLTLRGWVKAIALSTAFSLAIGTQVGDRKIYPPVIQEALSSDVYGILNWSIAHGHRWPTAMLIRIFPNHTSEHYFILLDAIEADQPGIVDTLLDAGVSPEVPYIQPGAALTRAIGNHQKDVVRSLIQRGADIHYSEGQILWDSMRADDLEFLEEMFQAGVKMETPDSFLMEALRKDRELGVVKYGPVFLKQVGEIGEKGRERLASDLFAFTLLPRIKEKMNLSQRAQVFS